MRTRHPEAYRRHTGRLRAWRHLLCRTTGFASGLTSGLTRCLTRCLTIGLTIGLSACGGIVELTPSPDQSPAETPTAVPSAPTPLTPIPLTPIPLTPIPVTPSVGSPTPAASPSPSVDTETPPVGTAPASSPAPSSSPWEDGLTDTPSSTQEPECTSTPCCLETLPPDQETPPGDSPTEVPEAPQDPTWSTTATTIPQPTPTHAPTSAPTSAPSPTGRLETPTPDRTTEFPVDATPSPGTSPETSPAGSSDTPGPTTTLDPTPAPTPEPIYGCPSGMVGVYEAPEQVLVYCIDQWEVVVSGHLGSKDQYTTGNDPTLATAASVQSVIPSTGVSYDQALVSCENTRVLHQDDGSLAGYKHISTSQEWLDAADGILGQGGSCYPYEGDYDASACATLNANNQQVYSSLQPTGSFPKCESRWGVMDQLGNAWEWADSGLTISIAGWFNFAWTYGVRIGVDAEGYLYVTAPGLESLVKFEVAGANSLVEVDSAGYLAQSDFRYNNGVPNKGYLKVLDWAAPYSDDNFLPIKLIIGAGPDEGKSIRAKLLYDDNGAPIPDKLGNAFYAGDPKMCANTDGQQIHFHDFDGTISFRCVSDPIRLIQP